MCILYNRRDRTNLLDLLDIQALNVDKLKYFNILTVNFILPSQLY